MTERFAILEEREKTYGKFTELAVLSSEIRIFWENKAGWWNLSAAQREVILMISVKLARILNGDPKHKDSWLDIAGYAHLGAEACDE